MLTEFTQTETNLKQQNLPAVILERHAEAVKQFTARRAEMSRLVKTIDDQRPARSLLALGKRAVPTENSPAHQSLKDSITALSQINVSTAST